MKNLRVLPAATLRERGGPAQRRDVAGDSAGAGRLGARGRRGPRLCRRARAGARQARARDRRGGGHNALLVGPPGAGKTMLARRLAAVLPPLDHEEIIEVSTIWSVTGLLGPRSGLLTERPFRAPHHTISVSGLVGGGSPRTLAK